MISTNLGISCISLRAATLDTGIVKRDALDIHLKVFNGFLDISDAELQ